MRIQERILKVAIMSAMLMLNVSGIKAQDSPMQLCMKHISEPYVSDGQYYTVLLTNEDIAEFYVTFYGGTVYRLVGYCGTEAGNLAFSVYDQERNLLFTNRDFENTPSWDFKFDNTIDCIIEAEIDSKEMTSGLAVMLIGFKQ